MRDAPESNSETRPAEDQDLVELLHAVGKREEPPEGAAQITRQAVHGEWRAATSRKRKRRIIGGVLASMVASIVAVAIGLRFLPVEPPSVTVGTIARIDGRVGRQSTDGSSAFLAPDAYLFSGDRLRTDDTGRLAVNFRGGVSLRLDRHTEVLLDGGEKLTVLRGAVYVDVNDKLQEDPALLVATPFGGVRHVGTQYEVRVLDSALQVSVREGHIEIARADGMLHGDAGERLVVSRNGVQRVAISTDSPQWAWTSAVAPALEIDNQPLADFLVWAGRELGREIVYASPAMRDEAGKIVLRGSVAGLNPRQALSAVLATTGFEVQESSGRIVIAPRS